MARSWVDIDLHAIAANAKALSALAPTAELCAVVKADGYGHGAPDVARAALAAGATRLAVAQVEEGVRLRRMGFDEPIWVLSEPTPSEFATAAAAGLEPAVYSFGAIRSAAAVGEAMTVHLKIDTGMGRVGAEPGDALGLARAIEAAPSVRLGSVWTHLACADVDVDVDVEADVDGVGEGDGDRVGRGDDALGDSTTTGQLDVFDDVLASLDAAGVDVPLRHAANSAGTIFHPRAHHDVIRCGIALYGLPPNPAVADRLELLPAMRWATEVSFVKRVEAGRGLSYGHHRVLEAAANVATIPVGYADGYRRGLWNSGGCVLIGGRRRQILGVVTMDQTLVDCGDDEIEPGDEVVLLGRQSGEQITAEELARNLGTINYEIPVAVGARVERRYHDGPNGRPSASAEGGRDDG